MSPNIPRCQHIKANGLRCGSPSLRERRYCFFHHRAHDLRRQRLEKPHSRLVLPLLEDANAIQMAIQQVAEAIAEDRIDNRRAGLLLFACQTAASNLKRVDFEPQQLREETDPTHGSELVRLVVEALELDFPPGQNSPGQNPHGQDPLGQDKEKNNATAQPASLPPKKSPASVHESGAPGIAGPGIQRDAKPVAEREQEAV